jgi:hypothetical protein
VAGSYESKLDQFSFLQRAPLLLGTQVNVLAVIGEVHTRAVVQHQLVQGAGIEDVAAWIPATPVAEAGVIVDEVFHVPV